MKDNEPFWDQIFKEKGTLWTFEPSESAMRALSIFQEHGVQEVLVPGAGYGRNALLFHRHQMKVRGIEISATAISLAKANGADFPIVHASVTEMPLDDQTYGGIFCYALLHLFSLEQRKNILKACYEQLRPGGIMVFTVLSTLSGLYGQGRKLSRNRFHLQPSLDVYFYDEAALVREFVPWGLSAYGPIAEPVRHIPDAEPLPCHLVVCMKN